MTRISCCVPFCRRTIAIERLLPDNEWLCAEHWRAVPRQLKAVRARLRRRRKRLGHQTSVMRGIDARSWELCKRAAIEAVGGLR